MHCIRGSREGGGGGNHDGDKRRWRRLSETHWKRPGSRRGSSRGGNPGGWRNPRDQQFGEVDFSIWRQEVRWGGLVDSDRCITIRDRD